jgi:hypothetical protein
MMLGIAWRWQANAQDGFRPETARRLAALKKAARRDSGVADAYVAEAARPRPGARLLRDWRGAHPTNAFSSFILRCRINRCQDKKTVVKS